MLVNKSQLFVSAIPTLQMRAYSTIPTLKLVKWKMQMKTNLRRYIIPRCQRIYVEEFRKRYIVFIKLKHFPYESNAIHG